MTVREEGEQSSRLQVDELFAAFPELAFRVDSSERVQGTNRIWSPLFTQLPVPGLSLDEVLGRDQAMTVRNAIRAAPGKGVGTATFKSLEVRARRLWSFDQHLVWIGENAGRRELESARRQAAHAHSELIRQKAQFLSSISHQLRTPLTAVLGYAGILAEPDPAMNPETRTRMLKTLTEQAWDLAGVFEDLLAAARLEIGELITVEVPADIDANVRQVLESMGEVGQSIFHQPAESAVSIGDPARIRQIIRNLVANALSHGVCPVMIRTSTDDSHISVQVVDYGAGIPDHLVDSIFSRFVMGTTGGPAPRGVGNGLWISKVLAEMMGGTLEYRREEHQTVFELQLPAADQNADRPPSDRRVKPTGL